MKLGSLDLGYFREKFQRDVKNEFQPAFDQLERKGYLHWEGDRAVLTREALLRVDALFLASSYPNIGTPATPDGDALGFIGPIYSKISRASAICRPILTTRFPGRSSPGWPRFLNRCNMSWV